MKDDWNKPIKELFSAIRFDSPHQFSFAGRPFAVKPASSAQPLPADPASGPAPAVATLGSALYRYAYSRTFRGQLPEDVPEDYSPDDELTRRFSSANVSRDRWEQQWRITKVLSQGQVMAQRGSELRSLWAGQFLSKDGPGAQPRPGAEISILYPKESTSLQPGFYYAFGETAEDLSSGFGLVRLYWNISSEGASQLIRLLTTRLNRFHVPFRFKCSLAPGQYQRTDAAVLYFAKRFFFIVSELMLDVHPQVQASLAEDVPFLTKRIADGLGAAEDPLNGESFGQNRCRLMAEAVWNCYMRGRKSAADCMSEFRRLLGANGVDSEHLHLNAGSADWYQLPREIT